MTDRSAPPMQRSRLAACIVAAGFLFAASAAAQTQLPPPAFGGADTRQDRIEELQRQLTEAEGQNEQLQRQLNEANREVARLRAMVGELAGVNQSLGTAPADGAAPPQQAPTGGSRPGGSADAGDGLNDAQRAATGTLGSMRADAAPPTPAVAAAPRDPGADYSRARELLVNGQYAEAEVAFSEFLEVHPQATQVADARFWFAFTQLARNNYRDAAANFVSYLQRTPQGPRAPEAQVRLGMALAGLGQNQQACSAFSALTRRYPNAPRNIRDLATREARAAHCAA
jgi:tol-pal system protein YbgF